jgi:hypothetical protein
MPVQNENERAQLEVEIMKYRNFLLFIVDEQFRKVANEKIAELEKKLREIDEWGRLSWRHVSGIGLQPCVLFDTMAGQWSQNQWLYRTIAMEWHSAWSAALVVCIWSDPRKMRPLANEANRSSLGTGDAWQLQTVGLDGRCPAWGSRFPRSECHSRGMGRVSFALTVLRRRAAQHAARGCSRVDEEGRLSR